MSLIEQYTNWTKEMYHYLSWRLFQEMYGVVEWYEQEEKQIKKYAEEARGKLTDAQRKAVDNRARRMKDEHEEGMLHTLEKMYGSEFDDDDGYFSPMVTFDEKHRDIWVRGVRERLTVKMIYDSTSSGISERLVDPYKTRSPYCEGFCHNRQEMRNFRFDRIVDIELTDKKFIKLN